MTEPDTSLNTDGSEDTASDTERRLHKEVARLKKENALLIDKLDGCVTRINHLHAAIRNATKHLEHALP